MTRNISSSKSSEYILLRSSPRHPGPHCLSASRTQCRWINSPPEHMKMDRRALEDVQEMGLGYHACQQHLGVAFPETVADCTLVGIKTLVDPKVPTDWSDFSFCI